MGFFCVPCKLLLRKNRQEIIGLLSHSPIGLRDSDILSLTNNKISIIELYEIIYIFSLFIRVEKDTGLICFKHLKPGFAHSDSYKKITNYVMGLPGDDWFKHMFLNCNHETITTSITEEYYNCFLHANTCVSLRKYKEAYDYISKAIDIYEEKPSIDAYILYKLYRNLMIVYLNLDQIEDALYTCNLLDKIEYSASQNIDISQITSPLDNVFDIYCDKDEYATLNAMQDIEETIITKFANNSETLYLFYSMMANMCYELDDFQNATHYRYKALCKATKFPQILDLCIAHTSLHLAEELVDEDISEIIEWYVHSIEMYQKARFTFESLPDIYKTVAELYLKLGDKANSLYYFQQALNIQIIIDSNNKESIHNLQQYIARIENDTH